MIIASDVKRVRVVQAKLGPDDFNDVDINKDERGDLHIFKSGGIWLKTYPRGEWISVRNLINE